MPGPSIQRRWRETPIYAPEFLGSNMTCNYDGASTTPSAHAPIQAGGTIKATWQSRAYPTYQWSHSIGPIVVYMARCPGTSCEGFKGEGNVWFKIQQLGLKPNATNLLDGNWMQDMIKNQPIRDNTGKWTGEFGPSGIETKIPQSLQPGPYLIRHEVFNYNIVSGPFQPQSFPNCAQLMVEGDGTKFPGQDYLVSFPGAYKLDGKHLRLLPLTYLPLVID